jgi:hypothetical protein
VTSPELPAAASSLLAALLDGAPRRLTAVTRTRMSVHYETGDAAVPVLCVALPGAVRLPCSVVVRRLPAGEDLAVGDGHLREAGASWRVSRWWTPPRPVGLVPPADGRLGHRALLRVAADAAVLGVPAPGPSYDGLEPMALLGAGPGLTPAGDDLLAGAVVTAHATGDPRHPVWARATRRALATRSTTAVSRGLLRHALDGYATPELADFLTAVCRGGDLTAVSARLSAVGHSSGTALAVGVLHTLSTHELRGAA